MPSSSSAARDAVDRLRTATIPALTVGVVAVLVLYAALAGLAGGEPMALGDALVVCAFALMTAHVAAADYPRYARLGIAWLAVVIVPAGLLVAVLTLGLRILAVHLAVIMLADSLVWALVLGVIDECAGTGRPDPTAPQATWHLSPRFPFVEARQRRSARQAPPATGGALASLVVLAVVEFAGAEAARAGGARGLLHPAPFAMLALGGVGALASLSRLVQQVGDTRRSVQITEGFVDSWVRGALAVLGVCALIALLVPKQLVTEPLRPLRESLWGQLRNTEVRYGGGRQQRPMPLEGLNRAEPGGAGPKEGQAARPGPQIASRPQETPLIQSLRSAAAAAVEMVIRAATAGEASPRGEGAQVPGSGGPGLQPGTDATGSQSEAPATQGESLQQKMDRLQRLLGEEPLRAIKLLLIALGIVLALIAINRYVRPLVRPLARWLWRRLTACCEAVLGPVRRRLADARHERAVSAALARLGDPFADPFEGGHDRGGEDAAGRAYESFLAHVWVWGQQKDDAQTAFDFARHLCEATALEPGAVWTVTRACVETRYSGRSAAPDTAALRGALAAIAAQVERTLAPERLRERRAAYRRMLAEQRL